MIAHFIYKWSAYFTVKCLETAELPTNKGNKHRKRAVKLWFKFSNDAKTNLEY